MGESEEQQAKAIRIQLYTRRDLTEHIGKIGGMDPEALDRMRHDQLHSQVFIRLSLPLSLDFCARSPATRRMVPTPASEFGGVPI
jgi:hypothetical protein